MVELLRESIKRRFLNKTTLILFLIIVTLISALLFSDLILEKILPEYLDEIEIDISVDYPEVFMLGYEEQIKNIENADISIEQDNLRFRIESKDK